jgi:prephenate dehydrogenase
VKRRPTPPFRRIAIVGVGLIGGSIGLAVRRSLRGVRVVGIDRRPVLRRARARGALHETTTSLSEGLAGADLVVLALPVDAILRVLPRVARALPPDAILTDVGSTKAAIDRCARRHGLGARFVGGHPMAGSERSGIAHADGRLFAGAPWVLCPSGGRTGRRHGSGSRNRAATRPVRRLSALVSRLGARPALLDPRAHDVIVARLSHLPQLVSVALTNAACSREARPFLHLAGPALRQMSRLADSPPDLWNGILKSNRRAAARALDDVIGELGRLRASLRTGTSARFRKAALARARLTAVVRGGGLLG